MLGEQHCRDYKLTFTAKKSGLNCADFGRCFFNALQSLLPLPLLCGTRCFVSLLGRESPAYSTVSFVANYPKKNQQSCLLHATNTDQQHKNLH